MILYNLKNMTIQYKYYIDPGIYFLYKLLDHKIYKFYIHCFGKSYFSKMKASNGLAPSLIVP